MGPVEHGDAQEGKQDTVGAHRNTLYGFTHVGKYVQVLVVGQGNNGLGSTELQGWLRKQSQA